MQYTRNYKQYIQKCHLKEKMNSKQSNKKKYQTKRQEDW